MHIDDFIPSLEKRSDKTGLRFQVEPPAIESDIEAFEKRYHLKIPEQVRWFYQKCDGLQIEDPALEIKSIDDLAIDGTGKVLFAIFDEKHRICFDVSKINAASQWDIVNDDTGFVVTLTMASFWTNKIFAWLDNKRTIWK